jgi:hypothetical protein
MSPTPDLLPRALDLLTAKAASPNGDHATTPQET